MRFLIYAIGITLALVAWGILGKSDNLEAQKQRDTYCDMIALWDETNGDAGWPPYKGECEDD
jgi:hypothetical protein